jgi:kynureninase
MLFEMATFTRHSPHGAAKTIDRRHAPRDAVVTFQMSHRSDLAWDSHELVASFAPHCVHRSGETGPGAATTLFRRSEAWV